MPEQRHLLITNGSEAGRAITVPPEGATLGRSSSSDIVLGDPALSRRHCRFEFHDDGSLWVVDFGSANQTLVNDKPVTEQRLSPGDLILVGDTIIKACDIPAAAPAPAQSPSPAPAIAPAPAAAPGVATAPAASPSPAEPTGTIDLGLAKPKTPALRNASLRPILWVVAAAILLIVGWAVFLSGGDDASANRARQPQGPRIPRHISLRYEKVEATSNNIFRYEMVLAPDGRLSVAIDDLNENRHVRESKVVESNLVQNVARELVSAGFFSLDEAYEGIPREGVSDTWEIQAVIDRRAHRCRVANRVEPEDFKNIRERLETFGKNELGIWAIQFSRERLIQLADDAFRLGRKKQDERDIAYENLSTAIRAYREAEFYLDTVDPKPDFYPDVVTGLREATEELERRHAEQRFRADRAINLSEWAEAASELRVLLAMIPDREDERHREAERKLIDVENRLKTKK